MSAEAGMAEPSDPAFQSREGRIAYNEAWFRDLNERKAEWVKTGDLAAGFRCECWRADCGERLPLSGKEWREVRSRPNRFAVAPGHIAGEFETVIKEYPHFWLVEKQGEAGDVAEELA
jgi:hypothetical protein